MGGASTRPTPWASRGIGASFVSDRCVGETACLSVVTHRYFIGTRYSSTRYLTNPTISVKIPPGAAAVRTVWSRSRGSFKALLPFATPGSSHPIPIRYGIHRAGALENATPLAARIARDLYVAAEKQMSWTMTNLVIEIITGIVGAAHSGDRGPRVQFWSARPLRRWCCRRIRRRWPPDSSAQGQFAFENVDSAAQSGRLPHDGYFDRTARLSSRHSRRPGS